MKKSFTLIELIIYIGLFSTVLVILTQIITSALNIQVESQSVSSFEQDSRYILARLNYDILRATSITIPSPPTVNYGVANSELEILIGSPSVNHKYKLIADDPDGIADDLVLIIDTNPPIRLNGYDSKISGLYFTRYNSSPTPVTGVNLDNIQIEFDLTSKSQAKSGSQTRSFKTNINLRCYSSCN